MALVDCPECNREVSDKAACCPSCGYPIQQSLSDPKEVANAKTLPTTNICNRCGSSFDLSLSSCPECQSDVFEQVHSAASIIKVSAKERSELFGIILVFIPILSSFLAFFWVGQMNLLDSPMSKLGIIGVFTVLISGLVASVECNKYSNDNPISEFVGFILLWILAYPFYLYRRKYYGLRNLSFMGGIATVMYVVVNFIIYNEVTKRLSEVETLIN